MPNPAAAFKQMRPGFDLAQAIAEADRCLLCHDAPCSQGCPADTRPAEFIRKLRFRNLTGAIRTIKANNILGGACGELCPTHRLCEKECSARFASRTRPEGADRPIQIGKIQRFLVEHGWRTGFFPLAKAAPREERIAVVGSGPAGLSCAAELAKHGFPVTVFEARPEPGGVLRYGVVAYRLGLEFLNNELKDIERLGVEFRCGQPIAGDAGAERLLEEGFRAVFLAPGLWEAETLKAKHRPQSGVYSSVEYLAALRDGRLKQMAAAVGGRTVAVIGGGSVAMDCVESAVRLGAKDVYLVYRRSFAQMPAEPDERIEALAAGVHFLLLNQPVDYAVDRRGKLKGIRLVRTRLGAPDASGRRGPQAVKGSEWTLDCEIAIEAIGNRAPKESVRWYPHVKTSAERLIAVQPKTGRTSAKGIYAGGDIVRGPALVVQAVRDGKAAAAAIIQSLSR
jgi:NADPH-dependent glutamate synthase beta subunit-like oxidoreductase